MNLSFKLDDYYDIRDKYEELFYDTFESDASEPEQSDLGVKNFRIIIPSLNIALREGTVYEDEEPQGSVFVIYKDIVAKPMDYSYIINSDISYCVMDYCRAEEIECDSIDSLECYIDTAEFTSDENAQRIINKCD